jgi:hypothetical protein
MKGSLRPAAEPGEQNLPLVGGQRVSPLEEAVLRTLAYGDVFDYAMTVAEVSRYLEGARALPHTIENLLEHGKLLEGRTRVVGKYVCLWGREALVELRRRRSANAWRAWPKARRYGSVIASLPFVRMVAVTGSLAVDNPDERGDIDYLVVAAPGRVWLCRAMTIAVVRSAALRGDLICPNYVLSENALGSNQQDLYYAHELAQMVPLAGLGTYTRMRRANRWTHRFLPNARGCPPNTPAEPSLVTNAVKSKIEAALSGKIGDALEGWEMRRKVSRFASQAVGSREADFCAEWCKGHFKGYAGRVVAAYRNRLEELGLRLTPGGVLPHLGR